MTCNKAVNYNDFRVFSTTGLLQKDECEDSRSHGSQGNGHTQVADNFQGRCYSRIGDIDRCWTQQYGKMCEVVTFTHCHREIGESLIFHTPSVSPLPGT